VVCASPTYLKIRGTPNTPTDLSAHDCISYPPIQSATAWRFTQGQKEYVVPVRSRLVVSNLESACDAARAGIGITVAFSYLIAGSIQSGELVPLLREFQPPPQPVSFVYSPNRFMPVVARVPRFYATAPQGTPCRSAKGCRSARTGQGVVTLFDHG
jgi:DNA-binding transcriptional LysR family regulator